VELCVGTFEMAREVEIARRVQRNIPALIALAPSGAFCPKDVAGGIILHDKNLRRSSRAGVVHQSRVAEGYRVTAEQARDIAVARRVHGDAPTIVVGISHGRARPLKRSYAVVFGEEKRFAAVKRGVGQAGAGAGEVENAAEEKSGD